MSNGVTLKTVSGNTVNSKFKFTDDAAVFEVAYKPKELNVKGNSLTLKHNSSLKTDSTVASTESVKFGTALTNTANIGITLDYVWDNSSTEQSLKATANVNNKDLNLGVKTEYSIDGKQVKSLLAQAAYNTVKVNHFLYSDIKKRSITYATISTPAYNAKETHACNIVFDGERKPEGFLGYPLTSSWAGIYKLNDDSTVRVKL